MSGRWFQSLVGTSFGRLTVISQDSGLTCIVRCSCGVEKTVKPGNLKSGSTKSCGCLLKNYLLKHGARAATENTPTEYNSWSLMRDRCNNPNNITYDHYGGRGIRCCKRWDSYSLFIKDMGKKPSNIHSLDRIDPKKGYKPSNCKWSTKKEQSRNRRDSVLITYKGAAKHLLDWADELGIPYSTVKKRYYAGKPPKEIFKEKKNE